jgi:hypothetical protein
MDVRVDVSLIKNYGKEQDMEVIVLTVQITSMDPTVIDAKNTSIRRWMVDALPATVIQQVRYWS